MGPDFSGLGPAHGRQGSFLTEDMIAQLLLLRGDGVMLSLETLGSATDSQIYKFKLNAQCVDVWRRGFGE